MNISGIIVGQYLLATLAVSIFPFKSWGTIGFGLILASIGSLATFLLLKKWESHLKKERVNVSKPSIPATKIDPFYSEARFQEIEKTLIESQSRQKELIEELNVKNESLHKIEKEKVQFENRIGDVHHELNALKTNSEEEIRRKSVLLSEYQETINQQRDVIKKKQELIAELESKVQDLNYEVKTLLQLAELGNKTTPTNNQKEMTTHESAESYMVEMYEEEKPENRTQNLLIKTPEEASSHLKRCIDIAQKITGANRFGNGNSRFKDIPIDNRALDLRRLFDNLRCENSGTVIVYSQKDNKLLFANNQTTNLLGWSPDKLTNHFSEIIAEGTQEWKKGIGALSTTSDSKLRLVMKTKSGQNLLVHCHLGIIPTGAFRNHIIGILYPA